jgi:hypothetical protein
MPLVASKSPIQDEEMKRQSACMTYNYHMFISLLQIVSDDPDSDSGSRVFVDHTKQQQQHYHQQQQHQLQRSMESQV